jgi:hypothetical protein
MIYELGKKKIKIPDADIEKSMRIFDITKEQSIQMWLEDEGYLINEEQEALCKKAKDVRITATIHQATSVKPRQKTQKERTQKENPTKEAIIKAVAEVIKEIASNVEIVNKNKLITFEKDGERFELDLKQKRKKSK